MNIVLTVCAIIITIALVAFVWEAIITFHEIRKTSRDIEYLTTNIKNKINSIDTISEAAKIVVSGAARKWLNFVEGISRFIGKKRKSEDTGKNE